MLVLALDTATPAVTAGIVAIDGDDDPDGLRTLAHRVTVDARAHGELLTPHVQDVLAAAGVAAADLDAIVCGAGPGPFTGLRAGMVTAAAFGHALGKPVHPVVSLDAIAADVPPGEPFLVVTDARRREVYWAAYDAAGRRIDGPHVQPPVELRGQLPGLGARRAAGHAAEAYADVLELPFISPAFPSPGGLAAVAAEALRSGAQPEPLTPLYLRRPDAMEPGTPKRVTAPRAGGR